MMLTAAVLSWAMVPATWVTPLSLPELTARADAIVVGHVAAPSETVPYPYGLLVQETTVDVLDVWKGQPPSPLTVTQLGGQVGDRSLRIDGDASFGEGESVVLFLERKPNGSWVCVGMSLGKFTETVGTNGFRWLERDLRGLQIGNALVSDRVSFEQLKNDVASWTQE